MEPFSNKDFAPAAPQIPTPQIELYAPPYNAESAATLRDLYVTRQHSIPEKMELYNASVQGRLEELRNLLIEKGYSISEEVSKEGHYWTVLHYAAHYGHLPCVDFIMNQLCNREDFFEILNL